MGLAVFDELIVEDVLGDFIDGEFGVLSRS